MGSNAVWTVVKNYVKAAKLKKPLAHIRLDTVVRPTC